jgi:hypothetical protein
MKKLEKLTKKQEELIPIVRQEWLDLFYKNKGEINKELCKKQIGWLYKEFLNLPHPFVWFCDSPLMTQMIINLLNIPKDGANLGANLWANLRDNLWANLGDNLRDNLGDNLGII